jgi:hypothetical protein
MRTPSSFQGVVVATCLMAPVLAAQSVTGGTGGRRAGLDVLAYDFRVEFPATGVPGVVAFASTATVARDRSVAHLALDLVASLQVDSARVNDRSVSVDRRGDSVRVALPAGQGDTVRVTVFYHGLPTDGLIIRPDATLGWTAFGDNFPDRARQWLALVDHPSDKAIVRWDVLAPATHRVIANGRLLEETPDDAPVAARRVRTRWATERSIYPSVMVIGVAPFAVVELTDSTCVTGELPGCVRQSVWTTPSKRRFVPGHFARAGEIMALFTRLAGPYPYEKLAHVASSTRYGGMENAGAIFYADNLFTATGPSEELIAHETAHQWFGDAVTEREWPHVWLSEGFATYFTALWVEHARGGTALESHMAAMRARVLTSPITAQKPIVDEGLNDVARVLNTNVYQKGGFVLHMLRREIGDSAFFAGIRSYYAAHRHGNAMSSDLQAAVERAAGRPLDWFFAQWLTRVGVADVTPSWRWDATRRALVVTVGQGGRSAPYRLSLSMDVTSADGVTQRVRIPVPAEATSVIDVPVALSAAPRRVDFDPDVSLLATIASVPPSAQPNAVAVQGVIGAWSHTDGGVVANGTQWSGTTTDAALTRVGTALFGATGDALRTNWTAAASFPLAVATEVRSFGSGTLRVQFRMIGGESDQNAGILFNLRPDGSYHYLRYNTKDGDLALWRWADGKRTVIAHGPGGPRLPLHSWQTLDVTIDGTRVTGRIAGQPALTLTQSLDAPVSGRVGLWVKRDAVTAFRDFTVQPARR